MAYYGYIVAVEHLRPHTNADKLQIATFFGNDTCVSLDVKIGDCGIYFPCDGQLSVEYCEANNLVRKKNEAGENVGGYLDPDKRNVRAIKLRGEKSDGIFMPLTSLEFTGVDITTFKTGERIDVINGIEICKKYIPNTQRRQGKVSNGNRTRKKKVPIAPLFIEHADTEQLAYNMGAFKPGDEIEITLKMHGTSQRTAYLPVLKGYKRTLWDKLRRKEGTPIYDWGYVSGTRRTILENFDGGYYGSNEFREAHSKFFEGKLWKGEEVYYEVVGFTHTGSPIMATADNKKLNDNEFIKQYGKTTTFSYGCRPGHLSGTIKDKEIIDNVAIVYPQSDIYVYRMTMTNEDGDVVEYTPDFMRYRCEQMGVKTVPVMWQGKIPHHLSKKVDVDNDNDGNLEWSVKEFANAGEWIKDTAEHYYDGPDPVGKTHIREGVVVRILNRPKFCAYKHKNWSFKVLENIVKNDAVVPDMEEAEEEYKEN